MQTFTDNHGRATTVDAGKFVVLEYYKGFLNNVSVHRDKVAANNVKAAKMLNDSYMMQRNYHWRVMEVK
jgi:hypothetical protein